MQLSQERKNLIQKLEKCKKVLIEVNQTCNLNCSYCFYRDYGRVTNSLSTEEIKELFINCPNANDFYLTGGECFTSKNIDSIIELLYQRGNVTTFTNGIILGQYDDNRFKSVVQEVNKFIISFDSFDFQNYKCRNNLEMTIDTIKRIISFNPEKVEVKVCITKFNVGNLENIFTNLIELGVRYLSVNFVFDINNTNFLHEVKDLETLKNIFKIIYKYERYFNKKYINTLYDLYIKNKINNNYPCIADKEYLYLDCINNLLICPGNCKKLGKRGNWKNCYSKECANEWEIMYER